ncbi:uncharacterized protein Tco025E_00676 [Trypanosoma conorhini]|uniref:Uncharacterized protein n=1 Tax=Trypanosoma conorhini TaxID=83891 RepID=A0A422QAQ2_9TRYP|nr:uncharacterized protein Tco025E_00676 [Trypanosoma conorhini]RNF27039.1 hypothetical protein Tco025E_00676 [Trypanosoma conorhini]
MSKPPGATDASETLEGLSRVIREAINNGCTDMLRRYHSQLVSRVLVLSSSIIETTALALRTDVTSASAPGGERQEDPKALIPRRSPDPGKRTPASGKTYKSNTISNGGDKMRRGKRPTRDRALTLPLLLTPPLEVGPTMNRCATSAVTVNVSDILSSTNAAPSLPHFTSSVKRPVEGERCGARGRGSSSEVMYLSGMREMGQPFVQDEALTDEEVRATLSLVAQASIKDKKQEEIQHSYYELLCVRSCELATPASPISSPYSVGNEGRCVRAGCFTKSIYAHHPSVNEEAASPMLTPPKSIKEKKQVNMRGASSQRPSLSPSSLMSTPARSPYVKTWKNGRRSVVSSKSKTAAMATGAAKGAAAKAIEDVSSVSPIVWRPVTPSMGTGTGVNCKRSRGRAGGQPICNKKEDCLGKNAQGEEDKVVGKDNATQFVLRTEGRVYTLHYTTPLCTQRKEANDEPTVGDGTSSPISISVVSPQSP